MKNPFLSKLIANMKSIWKIRFSEFFEVLVWIIISYLYSFRPISQLIYVQKRLEATPISFYLNFQKTFYEYSNSLIISLLIVTFPFLFKLIYLNFPGHYLKNLGKNINPSHKNKKRKSSVITDNEESQPYDFQFLDEERTILNEYLLQSNKLSEKILSKTNLYLIVGSMIALVGVFVFYAQSVSDTKDFKDFTTFFSHSFPRLGTLIFIEAIAFFFLKQYRITMDEFRYYEAIKRQRENQIAIISIVQLFKNEKDLLDKILVSLNLDFQPDKMNKDEASKILESQKINNNQNEIIDKFLELLKLTI